MPLRLVLQFIQKLPAGCFLKNSYSESVGSFPGKHPCRSLLVSAVTGFRCQIYLTGQSITYVFTGISRNNQSNLSIEGFSVADFNLFFSKYKVYIHRSHVFIKTILDKLYQGKSSQKCCEVFLHDNDQFTRK